MTRKQVELPIGALLKASDDHPNPFHAPYAQILDTIWDGSRDYVTIAWYQDVKEQADEIEFWADRWITETIAVTRNTVRDWYRYYTRIA